MTKSIEILESDERQRFTIAHELAHYLLGHLGKVDHVAENILLRSNRMSNTDERDANYLAGELLMPMHKIDEILAKNPCTIKDLAERLKVSEQAVSLQLGIV